MNKTQLNIIGVLLFSILIVLSNCAKMHTPQGTLIGKNGAHILRKSELGRALVQMIEMYTQSGSKNQPDFTELFEALAQLETSLGERVDQENQSYQDDQDTHSTNVNNLNNLIVELNEQLIVLNDDLNNLNLLKDELQVDLQNLYSQQQATQDSLVNENAFLQQLGENYQQEDQEYEQLLGLLLEAVAYLNEASSQKESAFNSFAQTNKNNLEQMSILLQVKAKKLFKHKLMFVQAVSQIFLDMKNGIQSDQDSIQEAIQVLTDLYTSLNEQREQLAIDYQSQKSVHQALIDELSILAENLQNVEVPNTQGFIKNNQDQIDIKSESLEDANNNLSENENNLRQENESWDKRQEIHNLLIEELENEISTVNQAESILEKYRSQNE